MEQPVKVLVTKRDDSPPPAILNTPGDAPNVQIVEMPAWKQVIVRAVRAYLQNVLGYILGAGIGTSVAFAADAVLPVMPARDFLTILLAALSAAIGPTLVTIIQNALELTAGLDTSRPGLRG